MRRIQFSFTAFAWGVVSGLVLDGTERYAIVDWRWWALGVAACVVYELGRAGGKRARE